jgi:hypothetical protein
MKRLIMGSMVGVIAAVFVFTSSGCIAVVFPGGPSVAGFVYTDVKDPAQNLAVATDMNAKADKMGVASAQEFLGIVAVGDGSIDAAMKNGGIKKIHHVDHCVESVLVEVWARTTTIVYGE